MLATQPTEASLRTYYNGHKGKVQALGWNRDGSCLASGAADATARLWRIHGGELRASHGFQGHRGAIHALAWDPTNACLMVTASKDKTVRVWDSRQPRGAGVSVSTSGENINVAWCPDGRIIAVGNDDDVLCFIDARKLQALHQKKYNHQVNEFSWSSSGSHFFMTALGGNIEDKSMGTIEVFNCGVGDGTLSHAYSVHAHTAACYCIDFDPLGRYFATGSADSLVSIWSLDNLICVRTLDRLGNPIRSLGFSHDGSMLASGSEDKFIDVASTESGDQICKIPTMSPINAIAWHTESDLFAFADESDGNVHVATLDGGVPQLESGSNTTGLAASHIPPLMQ